MSRACPRQNIWVLLKTPSLGTRGVWQRARLLGLEGGDATLDDLVLLLGVQLSQLARADVVDQAVDLQAALTHGVDDDGVLQQDLGARADVQLDQFQRPLLLVEGVQEVEVLLSDGPQRHQPRVDQAELLVVQGRGDATARGVPADDDVLDLEVLDGELDDRQRIDVSVDQDVGDVAVAEDLPGFETEDGRLGAARVRTADPEDLGRLALA